MKTGAHTGRSAKDKFTVRDAETENQVWWETNASITPEQFDTLWQDFKAHMDGKDVFVQQLFGGADLDHRLPVRVVNELAWHSLFIRHLLCKSKLPCCQPEVAADHRGRRRGR